MRKPLLIFAALLVAGAWAGANADSPDPWESIRLFVGEWRGVGNGLGGTADTRHRFEVVLQGKFIRFATRAEFEPREGESEHEAEIHEDIGFFSYDADRERIMLRQFLSEGYVNTYVLDEIGDDGRTLVFNTVSAESAQGTRARLRFEIRSADEYRLALELAPPGRDFFACRSMLMSRVD